jgi:murein DD-endopeptidase MepM/ murein hydrolase activator NlpD
MAKLIENKKFYNIPHQGSPANTCAESGCTKHRTFFQSEKDTCDAADIQAGTGTQVYAAFGGKVTRNDKGAALRIEATDSSGRHYLATYGHMTDSVPVGTEVKAGDKIGKVGAGHLHFELALNDRCVVITKSEYTADKVNSGVTLWLKMQKVLHLN